MLSSCSVYQLGLNRLNTMASKYAKQLYDWFLVLDFEATCDQRVKPDPQEIIEFPVLKVSGVNFEVTSTFHQYVEPRIHKTLTPFCTELTGIVQGDVDNQPELKETLQLFDAWMKNEGLLNPNVRSIFVTMGDWDLKTMLTSECAFNGYAVPEYFKRWINIKKPYADLTGEYPKGMMPMLTKLGIKHEGRHHSGIDDCKNIARILRTLAERGYVFK